MRSTYRAWALTGQRQWEQLRGEFACEDGKLLDSLLGSLKGAGARLCVEEGTYIDRDFSSAYAAFYATLFKAYTKYCRRLHFFAAEAPDLTAFERDVVSLADWVQAAAGQYLGFVVVRPLRHAPVSHATISAQHVARPGVDISVLSPTKVHLLGCELNVAGAPVTEQDTRTGACAQAAIWMAGRHLHAKHAAPWFSMTDITSAALRSADSDVMRSLPAGSDYLTVDDMVRALRAMGERTKVYVRDQGGNWEDPPERIVARYVDSGIPVIIGLEDGSDLGHAVVAIGTYHADRPRAGRGGLELATSADSIVQFVVNDDQRGAYLTLPVRRGDRTRTSIPFDLERHADFILIPLPDKVFITAETAETMAWEMVKWLSGERKSLASDLLGCPQEDVPEVDPEFHAAVADGLVARTYLTHGWRYRQRALKNVMAPGIKQELLKIQLPRYVWVTEFSLPRDVRGHDPCRHKVRGHVVVDATGSRFWESEILTHVPGLLLIATSDARAANQEMETVGRVIEDDAGYYPKIRGRYDYADCTLSPVGDGAPASTGLGMADAAPSPP